VEDKTQVYNALVILRNLRKDETRAEEKIMKLSIKHHLILQKISLRKCNDAEKFVEETVEDKNEKKEGGKDEKKEEEEKDDDDDESDEDDDETEEMEDDIKSEVIEIFVVHRNDIDAEFAKRKKGLAYMSDIIKTKTKVLCFLFFDKNVFVLF
jgi:TATA-binding protein-associated factor Taf7